MQHVVPHIMRTHYSLAFLDVAFVNVLKPTKQWRPFLEKITSEDILRLILVRYFQPVHARLRHEHPTLASLEVCMPEAVPRRISMQRTTKSMLSSNNVATRMKSTAVF
mmetsp:Transcript_2529/g.5280  ORF Transcript_2529/g.5280 Transcript_2529/m.5280 type:complete len:108 (-) Transcript_2529:844-1167(-)